MALEELRVKHDDPAALLAQHTIPLQRLQSHAYPGPPYAQQGGNEFVGHGDNVAHAAVKPQEPSRTALRQRVLRIARCDGCGLGKPVMQLSAIQLLKLRLLSHRSIKECGWQFSHGHRENGLVNGGRNLRCKQGSRADQGHTCGRGIFAERRCGQDPSLDQVSTAVRFVEPDLRAGGETPADDRCCAIVAVTGFVCHSLRSQFCRELIRLGVEYNARTVASLHTVAMPAVTRP